MRTPRLSFEDRVDASFVGRRSELDFFNAQLSSEVESLPLINIHGVTGTGKSFLLGRMLQSARLRGLPVVKVQFDGKDGEGSVPLGQHHEVLRHIALGLGVPTPRFATAYLAWSLSKQFDRADGSVMGDEVRGVIQAGSEEIINFLVTASLGPGGLLVSAAKAGWRFVADRVSTEPLTHFHRSQEGRAFVAQLRGVSSDALPSLLGGYLSEDLLRHLPSARKGAVRAVLAFDSWEQFEEQFLERRSRWFQEQQVLSFYEDCRSCIQFVIVGQRPLSWHAEEPRVRPGVDYVEMPLSGLARQDAESYLRTRVGIDSAMWIEALLAASCETGNGSETRHHSLTLGLVADTAAAMLAQDKGADPATLQVAAGDLEALVRRFMTVREEQEPLFERLALTPRCDGMGLAAALGKPYDEFNSLADMDSMLRYSFMHAVSDEDLSMHGLMRRMIRERIVRHRPDKLRAAHTAWRRHYESRGMQALAFRHALALEPSLAIEAWRSELETELNAGRAARFVELMAWGNEGEDERPYLASELSARFSLVRAWALRVCPLGDRKENLNLSLSLTDRAAAEDREETSRDVLFERGCIYAALAGLVWEDNEYYKQAQDAFKNAQLRGPSDDDGWFRIEALRMKSLVRWGLRSALVNLLDEAVQAGESALARLPADASQDTRTELMENLMWALSAQGSASGSVSHFEKVIELARQIRDSFTPEKDLVRWLETNTLISNAYRDWADYVPGTRELALSIECQQQVLEVVDRSALPTAYVEIRRNIAHSLIEVGRRTLEIEPLSEAVEICRCELEHVKQSDNSLLWSSLQGNMAKALCLWAERTADAQMFRESAEAYRRALQVRSKATSAYLWGLGCVNLADALRLWHRIDPRSELLMESQERYLSALEVFNEDQFPVYFAFARDGLTEVRDLMA